MTEKPAYLLYQLRFASNVQQEILIPEAKYDGKVEVMDSSGTSTNEKVNKVRNLGGQ